MRRQSPSVPHLWGKVPATKRSEVGGRGLDSTTTTRVGLCWWDHPPTPYEAIASLGPVGDPFPRAAGDRQQRPTASLLGGGAA